MPEVPRNGGDHKPHVLGVGVGRQQQDIKLSPSLIAFYYSESSTRNCATSNLSESANWTNGNDGGG